MTQIRFRDDSPHVAQMRFKGTPWEPYMDYITKESFDATPLPQPGDIWRSLWYQSPEEKAAGKPRVIAGYAICCPKCGDIHVWTTATNCSSRKNGVCSHSGVGSCWEWTGSAEEGTLTASPSLLCHECGYHGWLRNGQLTDC